MDVLVGDQIEFSFAYVDAAGDGVTGLTITVDVLNTLDVQIVTAAAPTSAALGTYKYVLDPSFNTFPGLYRAVAKTTDVTVQKQHAFDRALAHLAENDIADVIDGYSVNEALRLCGAALAGKTDGFGQFDGDGNPLPVHFWALDGSKIRITVDNPDQYGNRPVVTLDAT